MFCGLLILEFRHLESIPALFYYKCSFYLEFVLFVCSFVRAGLVSAILSISDFQWANVPLKFGSVEADSDLGFLISLKCLMIKARKLLCGRIC